MSTADLVLHDYWRSGAAYRTRIALELKGLQYRKLPVDLVSGTQKGAEYRGINPQGLVPTLETGSARLIQSGAILEWLEETYPTPPLLPSTPLERGIVRGMSAIIGCDVHPLNNLRVQRYITGPLGASDDRLQAWISHWISEGFTGLEVLIGEHGGRFAYGDNPTFVDCYLVPQVYAAERYKVDLAPFFKIRQVVEYARSLPAFQAAQPVKP
jgi:maleylpyruvate isomerase